MINDFPLDLASFSLLPFLILQELEVTVTMGGRRLANTASPTA